MNHLAYTFLADAEDGGKLWFWLIFGALYLIKYVVEHFNNKNEQDATAADEERREREERHVRELIEQMKKTPPTNPAPTTVQRPQPTRHQWQAPTPDPTQTLEFYMQAEERAKQSVNSLSNAEREALQRLYTRPVSQNQPLTPSPTPVGSTLKHGLRNSQALRTAILYKEILGPPKALH